MPKPFQRPPAPTCENGELLTPDGFCRGNCAYHGARQRLIYEFVNLDAAAQKRIADVPLFCVPAFRSVDFLEEVQAANCLLELWRAAQREGGDLAGECPL